MNHLSNCRKNLEHIFPHYGSDCTCGLELLFAFVNEHWDEGPEAVAEYLNTTAIKWYASSESGYFDER